ncbi:hypothetical protein Htur_2107 [Haloterrigena turkmenica DSM 5511]|uniref:CopG domain protein DNA-binding domain protein n=1 Tax=Haloterrigena turkmenica (strain ATCC 51198 / DSM 5511 / JCM 9101 / NCIMB 13204 / VKM B-1734 / 4k) TaxID=543526 RepID=D2RTN9_HALTV|nr:hypothetical protein [Haloterrigena turkmenica]ADB60990.1 hypothetical protein Htur_2107 [Haloterrigena turkmenica DSM 5511]
MSSEDDGGISFAPPGEVDDWLAREASRRGESRDDVCRRLVTAAHAVATDDEIEPSDLDDLTAVRARIDAQREEFRELLEDVRSRVVQVKRETDAKAPAGHDHPDRVGEDEFAAVREDLAALEATVDDGFENFETVLESLVGETAVLDDRTTALANAVVDLRDRRDGATERERRRAAADRLKLAANRLGIRTAVCDACDAAVDLALLAEPACPHCSTAVTDVAEKTSFFGSPTLVTGEPPALEGRVDDALSSPSPEEPIFDALEADATDCDDSDTASVLDFESEETVR